MEHIFKDLTELIGRTPLIELSRFAAARGVTNARVVAKLERVNPTGSSKDRAALAMIKDAGEQGRLAPGGMIIEPTSGNTGIAIAAIAAALGYEAVIIMPETMSIERRKLIAAYGARIILTPGGEGMSGAVAAAEALQKQNPGSIIAGQFENPANPRAHERATGPEIWDDTDGNIDAFVAGVGTGGTVTGVGRFLRAKKPGVLIAAVEPASSPLLSRGVAGAHDIQGIGANFVPAALDTSVYDEVITVTNDDARAGMVMLARAEGLLCGISSGAAAFAACEVALRPGFAGKTVVCLLPDTGERYLSIM